MRTGYLPPQVYVDFKINMYGENIHKFFIFIILCKAYMQYTYKLYGACIPRYPVLIQVLTLYYLISI